MSQRVGGVAVLVQDVGLTYIDDHTVRLPATAAKLDVGGLIAQQGTYAVARGGVLAVDVVADGDGLGDVGLLVSGSCFRETQRHVEVRNGIATMQGRARTRHLASEQPRMTPHEPGLQGASVGVRLTTAPRDSRVYTFSLDIFFGRVMTILYPRTACKNKGQRQHRELVRLHCVATGLQLCGTRTDRGERETDAGVSGSGLNEDVTLGDAARFLGVQHHALSDAVLD